MIRLIELLIFGHIHKWKILNRGNLVRGPYEKGQRYIMQCEKCGKVKKSDLI